MNTTKISYKIPVLSFLFILTFFVQLNAKSFYEYIEDARIIPSYNFNTHIGFQFGQIKGFSGGFNHSFRIYQNLLKNKNNMYSGLVFGGNNWIKMLRSKNKIHYKYWGYIIGYIAGDSSKYEFLSCELSYNHYRNKQWPKETLRSAGINSGVIAKIGVSYFWGNNPKSRFKVDLSFTLPIYLIPMMIFSALD